MVFVSSAPKTDHSWSTQRVLCSRQQPRSTTGLTQSRSASTSRLTEHPGGKSKIPVSSQWFSATHWGCKTMLYSHNHNASWPPIRATRLCYIPTMSTLISGVHKLNRMLGSQGNQQAKVREVWKTHMAYQRCHQSCGFKDFQAERGLQKVCYHFLPCLSSAMSVRPQPGFHTREGTPDREAFSHTQICTPNTLCFLLFLFNLW